MIPSKQVLLPDSVLHESNRSAPSLQQHHTHTPEAGPELEPGPELRGGPGGPEPSHVSLKSDSSAHRLIDFRSGPHPQDQINVEGLENPAGRSGEHQAHLASTLKMVKQKIDAFVDVELEEIRKRLDSGFPQSSEDEEEKKQAGKALMVIITYLLRSSDQDELAVWITEGPHRVCQQQLKSVLKEKFQRLPEGMGNVSCLDEVYTELFITEGGAGGVNREHEVRQIQAASWRAGRPERTIRPADIFKAPPGTTLEMRRVMTTGVAGIGKTVLTQRFTLDWAEGKANQDVDFTFPFTFRELNLLTGTSCSLLDLLHCFFTPMKQSRIRRLEDFNLVFIFDGLDECRLPLDFQSNRRVSEVSEPASVDALLTNLICGNLLPSARIWITTRPGASDRIPPACIHMLTEIQGFTNPQKEMFFRKRFGNKEEASRIISHVTDLQSLHIMCHIPIFCWITATVLGPMLRNGEEDLPRSLTEMYVCFLTLQSKLRSIKYDGGAPDWSPDGSEMVEALGKLAHQQLKTGKLIFYQSDLSQCGIHAPAAATYSGVFTQIFQGIPALFGQKVFCFVHLSVQEFLAALYAHLSFFGSADNRLSGEADEGATVRFYQTAVDEALQSPHGTLDLYLRFLLGLSTPENQRHLHGFLSQPLKEDAGVRQTLVDFIKEKMEEAPSAEQSINLLHCLHELKDQSLVEQIQQSIRSRKLSPEHLSPAQWSALVFILLSSEEDLQLFDLKKFSASEEALLKLLPVVQASRKALLDNCSLSERSCEALSSVLASSSSPLKELDLSNNNLGDGGLKLLCAGLESPHCSVEHLRLSGCLLTEESFASLLSVTRVKRLKTLDVSYNHLGDERGKLLSNQLFPSIIPRNFRRPLKAQAFEPTPYLHKPPPFTLEPAGAQWLTPGLQKYRCRLFLDANTLNRKLQLLDHGKTVRFLEEEQPYPEHPDRFECWPQVLCCDGLSGRSYWEVECEGRVFVSVSYRSISRKGHHGQFGENDHSWRLNCYEGRYSVGHNSTTTPTPGPAPAPTQRVAVYLDWPAGILSFYVVGSDSLIHLKSFNTTFHKALHPGFGCCSGSSVSLCSQ